MKGMTEVNITTAEGIGSDLSSVGCYISIDGRLYDVLTPLSNPGPDATIKLPETGELRLIIKNMGGNDQVFGSVSLPLTLLPEEPTRLWLPLFDHLDGDLLHAIPEDVEPPRVLLTIGDPIPLSPVPEMTERSSTDECESETTHKTASDDTRKTKAPDHQLEILTWKLKVEEDLHREEVDALKAHIAERTEHWVLCSQQHSALVQDLTSQVGSIQKLFSQEKRQTEVLTERLNIAKEEFDTCKGQWAERERKLCEEVSERETEIARLREEMCALQGEIRRIEGEKIAAEESKKLAESLVDNSNSAELQEALDLAVEQLADSEIQRKLLQDELLRASQYVPPPLPVVDSVKSFLLAELESLHNQLQSTETELIECQDQGGRLGLEIQRRLQAETELEQANSALLQAKDTILSLSQDNDNMKKELQEFVAQIKDAQARYEDLHALSTLLKTERVKLTNDFEEYRKHIPEGDVIDWLLVRFFSERGLGTVQRLSEGLYCFNNKKFAVTLRGASLAVRVGSGLLPMEGFMKIYMPMEAKHLEHSRSQSVEIFKRHRRINTMPESASGSRRRLTEEEADSSTNNTSQTEIMKPVPELDLENSMEMANRPARTPSPKRKQMHNTSITHLKAMSKTPKTPNRTCSKKSSDKTKRVPFRRLDSAKARSRAKAESVREESERSQRAEELRKLSVNRAVEWTRKHATKEFTERLNSGAVALLHPSQFQFTVRSKDSSPNVYVRKYQPEKERVAAAEDDYRSAHLTLSSDYNPKSPHSHTDWLRAADPSKFIVPRTIFHPQSDSSRLQTAASKKRLVTLEGIDLASIVSPKIRTRAKDKEIGTVEFNRFANNSSSAFTTPLRDSGSPYGSEVLEASGDSQKHRDRSKNVSPKSFTTTVRGDWKFSPGLSLRKQKAQEHLKSLEMVSSAPNISNKSIAGLKTGGASVSQKLYVKTYQTQVLLAQMAPSSPSPKPTSCHKKALSP